MISLFEIFLNFVKIGLFAFGGAYAAIPLIEQQIVQILGWMSFSEFADLLAIDELTPGPFIGMKLSGVSGAIRASLGCILPGCVISLILVLVYRKYKKIPIMSEIMNVLKCMSVALIFSVLLKMFLTTVYPDDAISIPAIIMMIISFFILKKYQINPIIVMLGCGTLTLLLSFIGI